jgi:6-phosphogluconolactonase (cycloisomerase 2 family)
MQYSRNASTGLLSAIGTINIGSTSITNALPKAVVSPNNNFVFATNGGSTLNVYTRNTSTNVLTSAFTYSVSGSSNTFCISPDGKFLYVVYYINTTSFGVATYNIDTSTGALTLLKTKTCTYPSIYYTDFSKINLAAMSPNGSAFYISITGTGSYSTVGASNTIIYQFTRNKSNGNISNPKSFIPLAGTNLLNRQSNALPASWPSGMDFSPDSRQLYGICYGYLTQINL